MTDFVIASDSEAIPCFPHALDCFVAPLLAMTKAQSPLLSLRSASRNSRNVTDTGAHQPRGTVLPLPARRAAQEIDRAGLEPQRGASQPSPRFRRIRNVQGDSSDTPITWPYCGRSRCQPMAVPGRYSVTRACARWSCSSPANAAARSRSGSRNGGIGAAS